MRLGVKIALGAAGLVVAMQVVRFEQTNPPVTGEIKVSPEVHELLKRACYDCHSNETVWPWYGQLAPGSWLMHRDVSQGRRHLNFSEWASSAAERKKKKQHEAVEELEEGGMPPWFYLPLHPAAQLSEAEKQALIAWAKGPVSE